MIDFKEIEKKWQNKWNKDKYFKTGNKKGAPKYYILVEFPYPSGAGLHVGHVRSYTALDALSRMKRMQGYNVLFPMGMDAFGSPAEQYAIKNKVNPQVCVDINIDVFTKQMKALGFSFDWDRFITTSDPSYYKWTQWQFLKFYEAGMAYKAEKEINWCPNCKTGLSNEDAAGGVCERCGNNTEKKLKNQWILRMTDYADDLIDGLKDTEFIDRVKLAQINWIGKSEGAEVNFKINEVNEFLKVFTTRPDTIYGVSFLVMSPEHQFLEKYQEKIKNYLKIKEYQEKAKNKTEIERTDATKEKTGVKIEGLTAINPLTNENIPIWISDYVLTSYGTGAIMSVPAHDERDYDFAKKYDLPIIEVIKGGNIKEKAYTLDGEMINSDILNGINKKEEAIEKIISYMEEKGIGKKKINYRLQDWIFSRQRYWGEPIPMIYCEDCGWVSVPEKDLPVILPKVDYYEPTENGESPLSNIEEWVNVSCPVCGKPSKRETDTMPNWAGSSWYWLRYMDPHNNQEFASKEALNYWGMVDYYNGGMEHAARHLLYARFWNQFLFNQGIVPNKEPFKKRVSHGMILGANGEKMSKSRGNVINPNDMVVSYGTDALRTYEMFIGDYEKDALWNENGLNGCKRFLDKIDRLGEKVNNEATTDKDLEILINQSIKKVTNDILTMKYNTAVSCLMILNKKLEEQKSITKEAYRILLHLLNPIAPHITEELNEKYNLGKPFYQSEWPKYDENSINDLTIEIAVSVNGKLRGTFETKTGTSKEELLIKAKDLENVKKYLEGNEILKEIVVVNKIVNIVVR